MERIIDIIAFVVLCAAVYVGLQYSSRASDAEKETGKIHEQIKQLERHMKEFDHERDNQDLEALKAEKERLDDTILSLKEDLGVSGGEEQTGGDEEGETEE